MPELPEVEVIRRDLAGEILGARIRSAQVCPTANAARIIRRHRSPRELEGPLAGATVAGVGRRGKYLVIRLDAGRAVVVHLGMSGQLLVRPAGDAHDRHTHVVIDFDLRGGGPGRVAAPRSEVEGDELRIPRPGEKRADQLRYVDPRSFGEMFVTTLGPGGEVRELAGLGVDPLADGFDRTQLARLVADHRMSVKSLLMSQEFLCGIGNIYSDEILFWAGVRPARMCDALSEAEVSCLQVAILGVLSEAIAHRGTSADDGQYRDLHGAAGEHRAFLQVYQREGQPCRCCGTPIQRTRWSNRSTHFCPACQR